jgi:hypothetical protein
VRNHTTGLARQRTWSTGPALAIVFLVLTLAACSSSAGSSSPLTSHATTSPSVTPSAVTILKDDFSDPKSGWGTVKDQVLTAGYVDGTYRMLVKQPNRDRETFQGFSNQTFHGLQVEVDATIAGTAGAVGVGCLPSQNRLDSYDFVIWPDTGRYLIGKVTNGPGSGTLLTHGKDTTTVHSGKNHILGECVGGAGGQPTVLTMWVNGQQLTQVNDVSGFQTFDGIRLLVLSGNKAGTEAIFDNALMSRLG